MNRFITRSNLIKKALLFLAGLILVAAFQNCSAENSFSKSSGFQDVATEVVDSSSVASETSGSGNGSGYGGQDDRILIKNCLTKSRKPIQVALLFRGGVVGVQINSPPKGVDVLETELENFVPVTIVENQGVYSFNILSYIFTSDVYPNTPGGFYGNLVIPAKGASVLEKISCKPY